VPDWPGCQRPSFLTMSFMYVPFAVMSLLPASTPSHAVRRTRAAAFKSASDRRLGADPLPMAVTHMPALRIRGVPSMWNRKSKP
jgi:hypothetical protein